MLQAAGFDVLLVDGRSSKQVPGRKTDKDCQWIQQLHSYGLLSRCFIPEDVIQELRTFKRLREDHIRSASMHVNHMQKTLTQMNIRLKEVIDQIHGVSRMKIIRAILSGERDPEKLTLLCHTLILKKKNEEVMKSLNGYYSENHLFALKQAVECHDFYQVRIAECDKEIEQSLKKINSGNPDDYKETKRMPIRHHKPDVENFGQHLLGIFEGVIQDKWPEHLEKMYRFWQTVLLDEYTYFGSPFLPHASLPLFAEHFERWISLFTATVNEHFQGEKADRAKWQASRMAEMFLLKINHYRDSSATPLK